MYILVTVTIIVMFVIFKALSVIKKLNLSVKRTLRLVLWTAEVLQEFEITYKKY